MSKKRARLSVCWDFVLPLVRDWLDMTHQGQTRLTCSEFARKLKLCPSLLTLPTELPVLHDLAWLDPRRLTTLRCKLTRAHLVGLESLLSEYPAVERVQLDLHDMWLGRLGPDLVSCLETADRMLQVELGVHNFDSGLELLDFARGHPEACTCTRANCRLLKVARVSLSWITIYDPGCSACVKHGFVGGHVPKTTSTVWPKVPLIKLD